MKWLLLFFTVLLSISGNSQEKRLALVIGNSAYEYGGVLRNPVNDAYSMKQVLFEVGFDVMEFYNLDEGEMKKAIDDFGSRLKNYDVGLYFYAGHGIQASGENYLIPVDANLTSEQQVEYDCVEAARVLGQMEASGASVKIMILDACRNNPFERSWTRSTNGQGLAFMNAPTGTLIAYATAPGNTASDGTGKNGLYTSAILKSLRIPNITILQMFQNVRSLVSQVSQGRQVPWESTSLTGDFYFDQQNFQNISNDSNASRLNDNFNTFDYGNSANSRHETVTDYDGNTYKTVRIGDQVWMAENLRVINYADGTPIPLVVSDRDWRKLHPSDKAYCWYDNSTANRDTYGGLYTWAAAMNGAAGTDANPSGLQGVCPNGWHLPSDTEWKQLEMHLGMSQEETDRTRWRGTNEGGKLKETGTSRWLVPNAGANNSSGFTAMPGGCRYYFSTFDGLGYYANFWTATEYIAYSAWYRRLTYSSSDVERNLNYKRSSFSVRCVKDTP